MRLTNQSPDQLQTVFGGEFVEEQHLDEAHRNLPPVHGREIGVAAVWLVFMAVAVVGAAVEPSRILRNAAGGWATRVYLALMTSLVEPSGRTCVITP